MPRSQQPQDGEKAIIEEIKILQPTIAMDVGCGDGKWADLLNGIVDVVAGIEIWDNYVVKYDLVKKYDELFIADAADLITKRNFLRTWPCDVIIFGDVIEHMEKEIGRQVFAEVKKKKVPAFLIIPTGGDTRQDGSVYGNPFETHVCHWSHEDVMAEGFQLIHQGLNPNGLVTIGTYKGGWNGC